MRSFGVHRIRTRHAAADSELDALFFRSFRGSSRHIKVDCVDTIESLPGLPVSQSRPLLSYCSKESWPFLSSLSGPLLHVSLKRPRENLDARDLLSALRSLDFQVLSTAR